MHLVTLIFLRKILGHKTALFLYINVTCKRMINEYRINSNGLTSYQNRVLLYILFWTTLLTFAFWKENEIIGFNYFISLLLIPSALISLIVRLTKRSVSVQNKVLKIQYNFFSIKVWTKKYQLDENCELVKLKHRRRYSWMKWRRILEPDMSYYEYHYSINIRDKDNLKRTKILFFNNEGNCNETHNYLIEKINASR